jgi:DNA polymerase V
MEIAMYSLNHQHASSKRRTSSVLLSLTHPNKSMFERQRALLRKAVPAGFPSPADDHVERVATRIKLPRICN